MSAKDAWQATLGQLELQLDRATFDSWVRGADLLAYEDGTFVVSVRNAYVRDWLQKRLYGSIRRTLADIFGRTVEVVFVVYDPIAEEEDLGPLWEDAAPPPPAVMPVASPMIARIESRLNPRYTFDRFVVGNSNELANAAARSVVDRPGGTYNPLFIYGDVGLGKTHLLHAIGNACQEKGLRVLYVSSEEFTNDLVGAIRAQDTASFRNRYRTLDLLMVDDVQFIAGKDSTQEEFFHTFNALHGANSQIVLASDRRPRAMATLEERLRSRFEWGLITDIQPPDLEMRMAILREKAEQQGMLLPEDLAQMIAQKIRGNIRELEGALTQIIAQSRLVRRPLTEALADEVLRDFRAPRKTQTVEAVLEVVADYHNLSVDDLTGPRRTKEVALARQEAMYLARETTEASLPQIGDAIGGRDHTTIMYGYNKIADGVETDEELRKEIRQLRMKLFEEE
ncbi:MAG: chromosomal replication initiator protein DnaA [Anaerolineae bacterium]|nr:chromosomal replication initiator protein DnaA [Anaerolineae bacterium]